MISLSLHCSQGRSAAALTVAAAAAAAGKGLNAKELLCIHYGHGCRIGWKRAQSSSFA
jgi:hypothetical protein